MSTTYYDFLGDKSKIIKLKVLMSNNKENIILYIRFRIKGEKRE